MNSIGPLLEEIEFVRNEFHNTKKPLRELATEAFASAEKADLDSRLVHPVDITIRHRIDAVFPAATPWPIQPLCVVGLDE